MPDTFLIPGGAGFIGSHLAVALLRDGHTVRIIDNFSSSNEHRFQELIRGFEGRLTIISDDVRDTVACRKAVEGVDFVLHHAAIASVKASIDKPAECVAANIQGTVNLLEEASKTACCRRFVFASSSAVYGDVSPGRKTEDAQLDPLSVYATTKVTGELLCKNFSLATKLSTVSLRYFNVYGPRQDPNGPYAAVVPKFIVAITNGEQPKIYGDGEQSRDFVSVHDIVKANIRACYASRGEADGVAVNIGSGAPTTLNQLIATLAGLTNKRIQPEFLSKREGDINFSLADITLAKKVLGFVPEVSFIDGLKEMLS